jgi:hypothetical protein
MPGTKRLTRLAIAGVIVAAAWPLAAGIDARDNAPRQTQSPPVPKPFPGSTPPGSPTTTANPTAREQTAAPQQQTPPAGGVEQYVFPGAEFIATYDAGRGHQQYHLYGTNTPYAEVVAHYKNTLRGRNSEVFRTPPTHQFDLGRFSEDTMAYPPSVVVKDYTWNGSPGYLHAAGTTEKRYRTIVQIVLAQ